MAILSGVAHFVYYRYQYTLPAGLTLSLFSVPNISGLRKPFAAVNIQQPFSEPLNQKSEAAC
jgi:hypothetical protein